MGTGIRGPKPSPHYVPEGGMAFARCTTEESGNERCEAERAEHAHSIHWRDINRIVFVAAAAGALWFLRSAPTPFYTGMGVLCAWSAVIPFSRGG